MPQLKEMNVQFQEVFSSASSPLLSSPLLSSPALLSLKMMATSNINLLDEMQSKANSLQRRREAQQKEKDLLEEGMNIFQQQLGAHESNLKRQNSISSHSSSNTSASREFDSDSKYPLIPIEGFLLKRSSGARKLWSRSLSSFLRNC